MNKNKKETVKLIAGIAAIVTIGIITASLVSAAGKETTEAAKQAITSAAKGEMTGAEKEAMMSTVEEGTMEGMHECTIDCVKRCQDNIENIATATELLSAASKSIDAGDMATAQAELERARKLLKMVHSSTEECMREMPCANMRCPMTGKAISVMDTPPAQTCIYKGTKVGFCCPACPAAWDKLTDAEKDAKLQTVMPKMKYRKSMMQKGKEMFEKGKQTLPKSKY